jgi:hypothetical protein
MKTILAFAAALTVLAPAAFAQDSSSSPCFSSRDITSSRVVDDSTINFAVRDRVYQAKLFSCPGLRNSLGGYSMVLRGGDRICSALDLNIGVRDLGGGKCVAQSLRQLTPAEAAALTDKEKP